MRASLALGAIALACSACATRTPPPAPAPLVTMEAGPAWTQSARAETLSAIDALPRRFAAARAALPRRLAARASAESALLDPAIAEPAPDLPPGPYHCRLIRLGGRVGLRSFTPDLCYVIASDEGIAFAKGEGENVIDGWIYPDSDRRRVLLGALRRGGEPGKGRYGDDPATDVAGIIERVSAFRWRLLLTRAGAGAAIDLYELVPVTPVVPGAKAVVPSD